MEKYNNFMDVIHRLEKVASSIDGLKTEAEVDKAKIDFRELVNAVIVKAPYALQDVDLMFARKRAEIAAHKFNNFGK